MAPGGNRGIVSLPFGPGGGANALSGFATANDGEDVAGVVGTNEGDGGIGVAGGINFPMPPLFLEHTRAVGRPTTGAERAMSVLQVSMSTYLRQRIMC